jgi:hypothetical protein
MLHGRAEFWSMIAEGVGIKAAALVKPPRIGRSMVCAPTV